jgi:hypothetical protein
MRDYAKKNITREGGQISAEKVSSIIWMARYHGYDEQIKSKFLVTNGEITT